MLRQSVLSRFNSDNLILRIVINCIAPNPASALMGSTGVKCLTVCMCGVQVHHHVLILNSRVLPSVAFFVKELFHLYGRKNALVVTILQPSEVDLSTLGKRLKSLGIKIASDVDVWSGGEVRLVHGNAMAKNELEAAGIQYATTVVILTQALTTKDGSAEARRRKDNQYLMDAESIMIGSKVQQTSADPTQNDPILHVPVAVLYSCMLRSVRCSCILARMLRSVCRR